jgi:acyl carrier protein
MPHQIETTREELLEQIRRFLEEQRGIDPDRVHEEARFKDDLNLDSLDLIELAMGWEVAYGLALEDEQVLSIVTVADAIDAVLTESATYVNRPTSTAAR